MKKNQSPPISEITINEQIVKFENENNLFQYEVKGWLLWPVIRFPFMISLMNYRREKVKRIGLGQVISSMVRDLRTFLSPPQTKMIALTLSSARGDVQDGFFKDIYFDALLAKFSRSEFFKM